MGDDLAKALCKQLEVELQLVKGLLVGFFFFLSSLPQGWHETSTVYEGGMFFVKGRFDAKSAVSSVIPHSASSSLSPAQLNRFLEVVGEPANVAVVERDGACSFFELAPISYRPPCLPDVYKINPAK